MYNLSDEKASMRALPHDTLGVSHLRVQKRDTHSMREALACTLGLLAFLASQ